jgi:hypothetical protein
LLVNTLTCITRPTCHHEERSDGVTRDIDPKAKIIYIIIARELGKGGEHKIIGSIIPRKCMLLYNPITLLSTIQKGGEKE